MKNVVAILGMLLAASVVGSCVPKEEKAAAPKPEPPAGPPLPLDAQSTATPDAAGCWAR